MPNQKLIIQCCVCGAIKSNGVYDNVKRDIIRTGNTSHGYCPTCYEIEKKKIEGK